MVKSKKRTSGFLIFLLLISWAGLAVCLFILFSGKIPDSFIPVQSVSVVTYAPSSSPSGTMSSDITALQQQNKELTQELAKAEGDLKAAQNQSGAKELEQAQIELAAAETEVLSSGTRLEDKSSYNMPPSQKYVYLTFDDGPSSNTPGILAVLKKNGIHGTFFVVYNKDADYYKQIISDGDTIALHTYTHDYAQVYSSDTNYFADLDKISSYVKSITGITSKIVRLPGGSSNTISRDYNAGIITRITQELTDKGYTYFDWNAQSMDATTKGITASQILDNVKGFTVVNGTQRPFIILLLHNGETEGSTVDALQSIIDYYKDMGYSFMTIDKDTPAVHQPIQN